MSVVDDSAAEFEGQIFRIPEHLQGWRGQFGEWFQRVIGIAAFIAGITMIWRGAIYETVGAIVTLTLMVFGYSAFVDSWITRCRRFGWRLQYMGTGQYIDAREPRPRLAHPAPGTPADIEDAETWFMLRRVRRLDGTRTW